jgi:hypothetical protein
MACLALFALLMAAGCGGASTGTVTGKVTYKKKPLKGGKVVFESTEGKGAVTADIGTDGSYTIDKAPPGKVKISVQTSYLNPKKRSGMAYTAPGGGNNPNKPSAAADTAKQYVPIPAKYESGETSEQTSTVIGGAQEKNIDLE